MLENMFSHKYPISNLHELDLSWILAKVDEMDATLKDWDSIITELKEGLEQLDDIRADIYTLKSEVFEIQGNMADIQAIVDSLRLSINRVINEQTELDSRLSNLETYVPTQISIINSKIAALNAKFLNLLDSEVFRLDTRIDTLRIQVANDYDYLFKLIMDLSPVDVYNRIVGTRISLDEDSFNQYEDMRYKGINNAQLSYFGIDNDTVASLVHNNRDYALFMADRLHLDNVYNPFTGLKTTIGNILSQLFAFIGGGISNQALYDYMLAEDATNDDIGNYYLSNQDRYIVTE
jgi:hypothetical protein